MRLWAVALTATLLLLHGHAPGSELQDLVWSAGLFGRGISGQALLVAVPGEGWRAEAAGSDAVRDDLLHARGDGWTLVGGPDGRVWGAPWGEALRELDPPLARTLTAAAAAFSERTIMPASVAFPAAGEPPAPDLRRRLASRADGRGGPFETITLRRAADHAGLRLASRRRPGLLRIDRIAARAVPGDPRDLLLPAWTLAELLDPAFF
ncbi:MAG TPA: hypothetical protein P5571_05005 [Candidatus Krumholzibacteria bacterium]|nr:hypothetical protein [Candidatus Krumholzibacteria bacterium]